MSECPVCLTTLRTKCSIVPCNHTLCKNCHRKLNEQKCPMCRGPILELVQNNVSNKKFTNVFALNKWNRIYQKEILLTSLIKNVFSFRFKNYLPHILYFKDNPYITKCRIESPYWNHCHFYIYKPELIPYYNVSEILCMLADNYNKVEYQADFMHVFISISHQISHEITQRENNSYFWNIIANANWCSEESKDNGNGNIMN